MKVTKRSIHYLTMVLLLLFATSCSNQQSVAEDTVAAVPPVEQQPETPLPAVEKKPATRELINWIRALQADPEFRSGDMLTKEIPYLGVLFKKSGDYQRSGNVMMKKKFFR